MAVDKTEYARSLGYKGDALVIVNDGRVISHGGVSWLDFCDCVRAGVHIKAT